MLGSGVFIFIQFKVVKLDTLFREDVFSLFHYVLMLRGTFMLCEQWSHNHGVMIIVILLIFCFHLSSIAVRSFCNKCSLVNVKFAK